MMYAVRMSRPHDPPAWWTRYFDEVYLRIYETFLTPAVTDREVAAVREMLGDRPGDRVLDVGCGWGRHSVELARSGFAVTGLDLSEYLLDEARRRAAAAGVEPTFVRADMREIPFAGHFDAAISLFSSLGYFDSDDEDVAILRGMRRAVVPGGLFILDAMHRDAIARDFTERDWWEAPDGTTVFAERDFDVVAGVSHEVLRWRAPDGATGEKAFSIRVRSVTEWADLLARGGWVPLEWFGGWDLEPLTHTSGRMVVLARRG
jgi:SAM-dependent methyltransferase